MTPAATGGPGHTPDADHPVSHADTRPAAGRQNNSQRGRVAANGTRRTSKTRATYWERGSVGTLPWLVGGLGLLGIGLTYDIPIRHSIEQKLDAAAAQDLSERGITSAEVKFTGRDGVLSGTLPTGVSTSQVLDSVQAIDGVRTVTAATSGTTGGTVPSTPSGAASSASTANSVASGTTTPSSAITGGPVSSPTTQPSSSSPSGASPTGASPPKASTSGSSPSGASPTGASPSETGTSTAAPTKAQVQKELDAIPQITFVNGTTRYTAQGRAAVGQAAAILRANPTIKVQIEGHTDDVGNAALNQQLSLKRAETVRQTLWTLGIAHDRMSYRGYGEAYPKLANTSDANRAVNRRVIFKVL